MKISTNKLKPVAVPSARDHDVQAAPVPLANGDSSAQMIKVDAAYRFGEQLIVAGWCTGNADLGMTANGRALSVRRVAVARHDVATHFHIANGDQLGFVLVSDAQKDATVSLSWDTSRGEPTVSKALKFVSNPPSEACDRNVLGPAMGLLALAQEPHSRQWASFIGCAPRASTPCRTARGFLEGAAACDLTNEAVVIGWVVNTAGTIVWIEDDSGRTHSLDGAFRRFRQDVHDAVGNDFGHASRNAGFVVRLHGLRPGSVVRLKSVSETGVHILGEITCVALPVDPVAAARWLFAAGTPLQEFHRRVLIIDEPVIGPLIDHRQAIWDELPVQTRDLGPRAPETPAVSVIVPLYGRSDFVEHQLIEFCADAWFRRHAELIYVIDDPKLIDTFPAYAEALYRLYRLPFRWVWGSVNRGFSGANNLGVHHARGANLVFLNSDVFPQQAGWLQQLIQVLAKRRDIGAVAPRLVFADGSIQHASMAFERREELGVWINHHPHMGLDPKLDPRTEMSIVPAVTGACLAMRRTDLDRIGGWDTGYLVGDFEDSDLCLKLRAEGLQIAYQPAVQLTHLERQSFKLLGKDEFRTRVVLYNAVRHQTRWKGLIEPSADHALASLETV